MNLCGRLYLLFIKIVLTSNNDRQPVWAQRTVTMRSTTS